MMAQGAALQPDDIVWSLLHSKEIIESLDSSTVTSPTAEAFQQVLSSASLRYQTFIGTMDLESMGMALQFMAEMSKPKEQKCVLTDALCATTTAIQADLMRSLDTRVHELLSPSKASALTIVMRAMQNHCLHHVLLQQAVIHAAIGTGLFNSLDGNDLAPVICNLAAARVMRVPPVLEQQLRSAKLWNRASAAVALKADDMSAQNVAELAYQLQVCMPVSKAIAVQT